MFQTYLLIRHLSFPQGSPTEAVAGNLGPVRRCLIQCQFFRYYVVLHNEHNDYGTFTTSQTLSYSFELQVHVGSHHRIIWKKVGPSAHSTGEVSIHHITDRRQCASVLAWLPVRDIIYIACILRCSRNWIRHWTMSSSTQDLIPQLDLGNTFGALFIGAIISAVSVHHFLTEHSTLSISCHPNISHETVSLV